MRLTEEQVSIIVHLARTILGEQVQVSVYGSRLDDFLRGGDLDLLLESPERIPVLVRAEFKMTLEQALQVAVDILVYQTGQAPSPFQAIALSHSRALGCTA